VSAGFGLPCPAEQKVTLHSWFQSFGLLSQTLCLVGEANFQRVSLLETAALGHALLPSKYVPTKEQYAQNCDPFRSLVNRGNGKGPPA
jgi:hypothetical protein